MTGTITFASPSGSAQLHHLERDRCAHICHGLAWQFTEAARIEGRSADVRARYAHIVDPGDAVHVQADILWASTFKRWMLDPGYHEVLKVPGHEHVTPFSLAMNTVLVVGGSVLELMARLHATCGIGGYVVGEDRAWLADIIQIGVDTYQLNGPAGWDGIVELLRADDEEPVVMSDDNVASWPNGLALDEFQVDGRYDREAFLALPVDEQWQRAFVQLATGDTGIDLSPDIWGKRGFGNGWSVFDLENWLDNAA